MQGIENYELDPNFAVVCSFLERFGKCFGEDYAQLNFKDLKFFLEASEVDVNDIFVRLHKKLARGIGEVCKNSEEWYKVIIKFCKDFPDGDNLLIKEKGYTNIPIAAKLRILKNLCEDQFEYNDHFNRLVNEELQAGTNLRHEPVGKDRFGRSYWFILDKSGGSRLFRRWWNGLAKEESWNLVSSDISELENLIGVLEVEDMKVEDLPSKKCDTSQEEYISPSDVLSTAADDAANMVYFSSKKDFPVIHKRQRKRTKTEILHEERKYDLPHCDVRLQRLPQEQLKKYIKQLSQHQTYDDPESNEVKTEYPVRSEIKTEYSDRNEVKTEYPDSNEVKTECNKAECKPFEDVDKNDIEHKNSTSNISIKSQYKDKCISSEVKDDPLSHKSSNQSCLKTCNDVRKFVKTNSDDIKEENESEVKKIEVKEEDIKQNVADKKEGNRDPLINSKGDACSQQEDTANRTEKNETCINSDTVHEVDSNQQKTDCDNEKKLFDHAIQDLLLLDGKSIKGESWQINKSLFNGTKKDSDVINGKQKCFNEGKVDTGGLSGVDKDRCKDKEQEVVVNTLKDLSHVESQKSLCTPSLLQTECNRTLKTSSEVTGTASSVDISNIIRLNNDKKSVVNSSGEILSCKTHSEVVPETKGNVKDETLNKENKVIKNDSQDKGRNVDNTHTSAANKGEKVKVGEKKTMSMLVGDEVIQIEEASSDSEEERQSEQGKSVNNVSSLSLQEKTGKIMMEASNNLEESGKVLNEVVSRPNNFSNSDILVMKPDRHPPVTVSKVGVQASKSSTINSSGCNVVYISAGSNLQKTILVNSPAQIPVSKCQTKVSSLANIKTVFVPLVTNSVMLNALPCSQPQSQVMKSILHHPVVPLANNPNPLLKNSGVVRTILHSRLTTGTSPNIVFAPAVPVPTVITLQKPLSSQSSHIVQRQSSNAVHTVSKPATNCDKTIICTTVSPSVRSNIVPKQPVNIAAKPVTICDNTLNNINVSPYVRSTGNLPTIVSAVEVKQPNVSVRDVTIVVGKDGIHYDKSTGEPYKYPADKKYVIAGPRGKFYDKETGYEVDVPQSENLKHIPGTVYLASGVSFTKEVMEKFFKGKKKKQKQDSSAKKCKKSKNSRVEITSSDEEFEKMLESEMEKSSDEESDCDVDYDYDKLSERVRTARSRKLPVREQYEGMDIGDEEDVESDSEMVPLVLGRNAKRAAVSRIKNSWSDVSEDESEDGDSSKLCTVCSNQDKPSLVLLCDDCGNGYHMSCLLPPLLLVPIQDWFCPQCEHNMLIKNLKEKLKEVKKVERASRNKSSDRISKKAFSIDTENIVEIEKRSCRQRKEVSYNDASYDNMFKNMFKEVKPAEKKSSPAYSSDSETETNTQTKVKKTRKRAGDRQNKSRRLKKSVLSGQSKAKKRKLTSLEDESEGSGSEYKQTEESDNSEIEIPTSKSENLPGDELYFTSSGRQTKHISYKIT